MSSKSNPVIQCKVLSVDALVPEPVYGLDNCYQLFLTSDMTFEQGFTTVDSGFMLSVNDGFQIITGSCSKSVSHGLLVVDYNTSNTIEHPSNKYSDDVPRFCYYVFNAKNPVKLNAGTPLGRFTVSKSMKTSIKEVHVILNSEIKIGLGPVFKAPEIISVPKTESVWFKRKWESNYKLCLSQLMQPENDTENEDLNKFLLKLDEFKQSDTFINTANQKTCESKWVWENIPAYCWAKIKELFKLDTQKHN